MVGALGNAAILLSVCLSVQCPKLKNGAFKGREAVVDAASKAFARLLHYRYAPTNGHRRGWDIVSPRDTLLL